jgi:hypothetical protein
MNKLFLSVLVLLTIISCGPSTQIVKSWRDPASTVTPGPSNKIFVIAMVKDESSRRIVEDELVKRMAGNAIASYTVLPAEMMKAASAETLNHILLDGQYTHVLMMLLTDIENETYYVPGSTSVYYGGYGSYYGYGASFYSDPGYYATDKNYFVETTVYSIKPDKLIWTGTTKTVNPTQLEKTVNDIANAVTYKMKEDGFLIEAKK